MKLSDLNALDIQLAFRTVFSSPDGQKVLQFLMYELRWWSPVETESDRVLHNFALRIRELLGFDDPDNWDTQIEKLLQLSPGRVEDEGHDLLNTRRSKSERPRSD